MVVPGRDDDDLGSAAIFPQPLDQELYEGLGDDSIPDTIRAIEVEGFQLPQIDDLRLFHMYDARPKPDPDMTRDSEEDEVCIFGDGFEHDG